MSLPAFRDYCRTMAADATVDPRDAELWTQLADEVDAYLGDQPLDPASDLDLFTTPPDRPPRRPVNGRPIEDTPPL